MNSYVFPDNSKRSCCRRHVYRIANPVRFFFFILITIMIAAFAGYTIFGGESAEAEAVSAESYTEVVIQENDNLWDIVSYYAPDCDTREVIHEVYELNGINSGTVLYPGDRLTVPVYRNR